MMMNCSSYQKTTMWAQVSFVLSQSTRLTDRWIDGQKGLDNTVRNALGYMQWHGKNDGLE